MPRRCGANPVTSTPSNRTLPALARMHPVMNPRVVVLPQPDGPTSATSSPWPTVRLSPCTAATWPYSTVRPSMSNLTVGSHSRRRTPSNSTSNRAAEPADADQAPLQDREDGQHWHERDQAAGRQQRPVDAVADLLDVPLERHGVRLGRVLRDQDQR